jgi:PHP family Zn ribbon phosphoesterase
VKVSNNETTQEKQLMFLSNVQVHDRAIDVSLNFDSIRLAELVAVMARSGILQSSIDGMVANLVLNENLGKTTLSATTNTCQYRMEWV